MSTEKRNALREFIKFSILKGYPRSQIEANLQALFNYRALTAEEIEVLNSFFINNP